MTDLDKLIEAVEGEAEAHVVQIFAKRLSSAARDHGDCWPSHDVEKAFRGSLDAAKALHKALLPGWVFVVSDGSASVLEKGNGFATMEKHYCDNPARAWLTAILKAHRGSNTDS